MPHHVFLSYSRTDTDTMLRIRDEFRARGLDVWTDDNLTPGTRSWKIAIQKAIEESRTLVVLLSPDAKESEWVDRELEYARLQDVPIFPVLIRGDEASAVPFEVAATQRVELTDPATFDDGVDQLFDTLSKYLGLRTTPKPSEIEAALLEFGSHIPSVTHVVVVTAEGLRLSSVYVPGRAPDTTLSTPQVAAMLATTIGLSERIQQRLETGRLTYQLMASESGTQLAIPVGRMSIVLVLREIVSLDGLLRVIERALPPVLEVLEIDAEVRF